MSASFVPPSNLIDAARDAVARWEKGDLADAVRRMDAALKAIDANRPTPAEVAAAEDEHDSDEVEVDSAGNAFVSRGDDGYWVSAWVWMPNS